VSDQTTLAACPFCGSINISAGEVAGQGLVNDDCTQSACMDCGALGPEAPLDGGPDYGGALSSAAWNRRASANGDVSAYIASLVAEVEALRVDAERYRYLRDKCGDSHLGVFKHAWDSHHRTWLSGATLDAAIDAARLSAKEPT
jgi:hypothetical protein